MKNIFSFLFFFCAAVQLHAQITVTQWDVAGVGKMLSRATDTAKTLNPGSINPGPAGANKTWNFSTLGSHLVDTLIFTNPGWLPNGSNFPNANLVIVSKTDSSEVYFENIASGLFMVGAYGDPIGLGTMLAKFSPPERVAAFPMTYNSAFKDTSVVEMLFAYSAFPGFDSIKVKETKTKDVKTDGWGTTITPLGSFASLRTRGQVITIDSIWLHNASPPGWLHAPAPYSPTIDTSWHFAWWANGVGFTVVEFDSTTADTIRNITWLKMSQVIGAVPGKVETAGLSLYPNPSSGDFYIEISNPDISSVQVFDFYGRMIMSFPFDKGTRVVKCTANSLVPGAYLYRAVNSSGVGLGAGRFEVVR